jgi:hypothetical protein
VSTIHTFHVYQFVADTSQNCINVEGGVLCICIFYHCGMCVCVCVLFY